MEKAQLAMTVCDDCGDYSYRYHNEQDDAGECSVCGGKMRWATPEEEKI